MKYNLVNNSEMQSGQQKFWQLGSQKIASYWSQTTDLLTLNRPHCHLNNTATIT